MTIRELYEKARENKWEDCEIYLRHQNSDGLYTESEKMKRFITNFDEDEITLY